MKAAIGIFVGGKAKRMGGVPKGLLLADGMPIVERTARLAAALGEVVLVGKAEAYAHLGYPFVEDIGAEGGPLGGLVGLLAYSGQRHAIALACDLPLLSPGLLSRLATEKVGAVVLAPRSRPRRGEAADVPSGSEGFWEPLLARYDAARALPVAKAALADGERSMQPLLDRLGASELVLDAAERQAIRDWDRPGDFDDLRL